LYNPGGFGREFRASESRWARRWLLALMVVDRLSGRSSSCWHRLAAYRWCLPDGPDSRAGGAEATGRFWLVGLYVTLLLFMQLIYPLLVVLAIVDSLIDFRGRLSPKDADNANGEG
jgi:hypothetical protein